MKRFKAKITMEVFVSAESEMDAASKLAKAAKSARILLLSKTMIQQPAQIEKIDELPF